MHSVFFCIIFILSSWKLNEKHSDKTRVGYWDGLMDGCNLHGLEGMEWRDGGYGSFWKGEGRGGLESRDH